MNVCHEQLVAKHQELAVRVGLGLTCFGLKRFTLLSSGERATHRTYAESSEMTKMCSTFVTVERRGPWRVANSATLHRASPWPSSTFITNRYNKTENIGTKAASEHRALIRMAERMCADDGGHA